MKHVKIKIKLEPGATMPTRAHDTDVGYDVTCMQMLAIHSNGAVTIIENIEQLEEVWRNNDIESISIDTGVHVTPSEGYYVELVPNSRQSKTTVRWGNSIGVIDPGYTGTIKVVLGRGSWQMISCLKNYTPGKVVGQLIIRNKYDAVWEQVDELEETERGAGGFGSTEKICHPLFAENAKQNDLSCTSGQQRNETDP